MKPNFEALYKNQLAVNTDIKTRNANLINENKKLKGLIFNLERDTAHAEAHNEEAYHYEV